MSLPIHGGGAVGQPQKTSRLPEDTWGTQVPLTDCEGSAARVVEQIKIFACICFDYSLVLLTPLSDCTNSLEGIRCLPKGYLSRYLLPGQAALACFAKLSPACAGGALGARGGCPAPSRPCAAALPLAARRGLTVLPLPLLAPALPPPPPLPRARAVCRCPCPCRWQQQRPAAAAAATPGSSQPAAPRQAPPLRPRQRARSPRA